MLTGLYYGFATGLVVGFIAGGIFVGHKARQIIRDQSQ